MQIPDLSELTRNLRQNGSPDHIDQFPKSQLDLLQAAGGAQWNLPEEFEGTACSAAEMLEIYLQLSSACLTTTFALTQRNAACDRIVSSLNEGARRFWLPQLSRGDIWATVGISHLTTSRQHLNSPPVIASPQANGSYRLNGTVPWATGAAAADMLVTGGTLDDGRQLLAAVPTESPGVTVGKPVGMLALNSSQTGPVVLNDVQVPADQILHGPVEGVMKQGAGGGAGSLGTSTLALGHTHHILEGYEAEASKRPDLLEYVRPLREEWSEAVTQLRTAASGVNNPPLTSEQIRRRANSLVLRAAQSWLAATKGAGFVTGHPAERALRESLFFLVWSCPHPVLQANLKEFSASDASFCDS